MGIREFDRWVEVTMEQTRGRAVSPDSPEGFETDPWWQEAHRKRG